jgi:hypothetical protein
MCLFIWGEIKGLGNKRYSRENPKGCRKMLFY